MTDLNSEPIFTIIEPEQQKKPLCFIEGAPVYFEDELYDKQGNRHVVRGFREYETEQPLLCEYFKEADDHGVECFVHPHELTWNPNSKFKPKWPIHQMFGLPQHVEEAMEIQYRFHENVEALLQKYGKDPEQKLIIDKLVALYEKCFFNQFHQNGHAKTWLYFKYEVDMLTLENDFERMFYENEEDTYRIKTFLKNLRNGDISWIKGNKKLSLKDRILTKLGRR